VASQCSLVGNCPGPNRVNESVPIVVASEINLVRMKSRMGKKTQKTLTDKLSSFICLFTQSNTKRHSEFSVTSAISGLD
jgi:hypothetical protein